MALIKRQHIVQWYNITWPKRVVESKQSLHPIYITKESTATNATRSQAS